MYHTLSFTPSLSIHPFHEILQKHLVVIQFNLVLFLKVKVFYLSGTSDLTTNGLAILVLAYTTISMVKPLFQN